MSNITRLSNTRDRAARIFKTSESKLYFPVVERPAAFVDKYGKAHKIDDLKCLVRLGHDNKPVHLKTVGKGYGMVHNSELFPHIEEQLASCIDPNYLHDVEVIDTMAYNGRDCYREYRFPHMRCNFYSANSLENDNGVAFRLIVGNSYGGKSLQLIAGAIDFFCTNGMVVGRAERHTRRHTSGISIPKLGEWVLGMTDIFWKNADTWSQWQGKKITAEYAEKMFADLEERKVISKARAKWLTDRFMYECEWRGESTLWEVYSSLTQWASHSAIRDTGNDHAASTRVSRELDVNRIMSQAVRYMEAA